MEQILIKYKERNNKVFSFELVDSFVDKNVRMKEVNFKVMWFFEKSILYVA